MGIKEIVAVFQTEGAYEKDAVAGGTVRNSALYDSNSGRSQHEGSTNRVRNLFGRTLQFELLLMRSFCAVSQA